MKIKRIYYQNSFGKEFTGLFIPIINGYVAIQIIEGITQIKNITKMVDIEISEATGKVLEVKK